jgi:hypothetical protein
MGGAAAGDPRSHGERRRASTGGPDPGSGRTRMYSHILLTTWPWGSGPDPTTACGGAAGTRLGELGRSGLEKPASALVRRGWGPRTAGMHFCFLRAEHNYSIKHLATRLAGPRVGAFWKPGDPALISLPGPAWLGAR